MGGVADKATNLPPALTSFGVFSVLFLILLNFQLMVSGRGVGEFNIGGEVAAHKCPTPPGPHANVGSCERGVKTL